GMPTRASYWDAERRRGVTLVAENWRSSRAPVASGDASLARSVTPDRGPDGPRRGQPAGARGRARRRRGPAGFGEVVARAGGGRAPPPRHGRGLDRRARCRAPPGGVAALRAAEHRVLLG